jgi:hypothetical protein
MAINFHNSVKIYTNLSGNKTFQVIVEPHKSLIFILNSTLFVLLILIKYYTFAFQCLQNIKNNKGFIFTKTP